MSDEFPYTVDNVKPHVVHDHHGWPYMRLSIRDGHRLANYDLTTEQAQELRAELDRLLPRRGWFGRRAAG